MVVGLLCGLWGDVSWGCVNGWRQEASPAPADNQNATAADSARTPTYYQSVKRKLYQRSDIRYQTSDSGHQTAVQTVDTDAAKSLTSSTPRPHPKPNFRLLIL